MVLVSSSSAFSGSLISYPEIRELLGTERAVCAVAPITLETHDLGLQIAERYRFALNDALIVVAALLAGCATLYSEDLQDGQTIDGRPVIGSLFAACPNEAGARDATFRGTRT